MKIYLQKYRTERGISTRELSEMTGIARSYIIKIEAGKANPSSSILCKLSKALEIDIADLIKCD